VTVSVDGKPIGSTVVNPDGTWSFTPTTDIPQGHHTVTARQTDPAGNTSPAGGVGFDIVPAPIPPDTTAPAAPVILTPADGSTTMDPTPTITGTGEPGATVTVSVDGQPVGSTVVKPDGSWSFTPTSLLPNGPHTVTARQTDPSGNTSPEVTNHFTVDSSGEVSQSPTITAPVILTPADGSTTTNPSPTVTGYGVPGTTVIVSVDGTPIGSAVVSDDGTWSVQTRSPLPNGRHTVTAQSVDPSGRTSPVTQNTFTVTAAPTPPDTTAPDAPVITSPTTGSTTSNPTPTITGTGEPGATVTVSLDGKPIGSTVVKPDGTWSFTPTSPLPQGAHTVTVTQTDPSGNTSPSSSVDFTVSPPVSTKPGAPVITGPSNGSTTGTATPTITGTGQPGATITVSVDGHPIGTTVVNPDGTWSFTPTSPLPDGSHTISVTQTDGDGNTSPATSVTVTVDTTPPAAPVITGPANGSTTNNSTPRITGTGEPGATVMVSIDGKPAGSTTVGADGTWSFVPTSPLGSGTHAIMVSQIDKAGNVSPSTGVTFTVAAAAVKAATGGAVTSNSQGVALAALACLAIAGVLVLTKRSVLRSGPGE
jgi:hypothetical protein